MPFREVLVAGVNLVRSAIQSAGFIAGSTGWRIKKDGTAEFNDVDIRGTITVGGDTEPQVIINQGGSGGYVQFPTNGIHENLEAYIIASALNAGAANEYESLQIQGPSTDGATNNLRLSISSQNNDGSSNANLQINSSTGLLLFTVDKDITIIAAENKLQWGDNAAEPSGLQYYEEWYMAGAFLLRTGVSELLIYDTLYLLKGGYASAYDSSGHWTCPASGYYIITGKLLSDALAANATRTFYDFRKPSGGFTYARTETPGLAGTVDAKTLTIMQWFDVGDVLEGVYFQNSGANRNMNVASTAPRSISFKRIL